MHVQLLSRLHGVVLVAFSESPYSNASFTLDRIKMKPLSVKPILDQLCGAPFVRRKLKNFDRYCWVARLENSIEALSVAERLAPELEAHGAAVYAGRSAPVAMVTLEMLNAFAEGGKPLPEAECWREVVVIPKLAMPDVLGLFEVEGFPGSMRSHAAHRRDQIAAEIKDFVTRVHTSVGPVRLIALDRYFVTFAFQDEVSVKDRQVVVDVALDINSRYFPSGPSPRSTGKHWVKLRVFGFGPT